MVCIRNYMGFFDWNTFLHFFWRARQIGKSGYLAGYRWEKYRVEGF